MAAKKKTTAPKKKVIKKSVKKSDKKPDVIDLGLSTKKNPLAPESQAAPTCASPPPQLTEEEKKIADKKSEKIMYIILFIIFASFAILLFKSFGGGGDAPEVFYGLDDMHRKNIQRGGLGDDLGLIYNGFSFVKADDMWNTQIQFGNKLYELWFNYTPYDLMDVKMTGRLDKRFNEDPQVYLTHDPNEDADMKVIAVSFVKLVQNLINAVHKMPIAACTLNETMGCEDRPIISCDNTDHAVIYIQESPGKKGSVVFDGNCITISGEGEEIRRGTERLLYHWYKIIPTGQ